ncbi:MAG: hypothetical protein ACI4BC_05275, partial [Muribaculaceae bacterium]
LRFAIVIKIIRHPKKNNVAREQEFSLQVLFPTNLLMIDKISTDRGVLKSGKCRGMRIHGAMAL